MHTKARERERAITLRKQGKTYAEILAEVPVSKSTLSLWLRDVGLGNKQQQRLTEKKRIAQLRGAHARKHKREQGSLASYATASRKVGTISKHELMLIGAALYWAEGCKEKSHNIGQGIDFANTDPEMVKVFLRFLREVLDVSDERIRLSLYIHRGHASRVRDVCGYWKQIVGGVNPRIEYVYLKKHNPKTKRKRTDAAYRGTLRITIRRSTNLQREIQGLIYGITGAHCRVV